MLGQRLSSKARPDKACAFVSYCHKDRRTLNLFKPFFEQLERAGTLSIWDDTKLRPGDLWQEEIQAALNRASVALLFVSQEFLASPFIANDELPPLLGRAAKKGLQIWWLPLSDSLYEQTAIAKYQALIDPKKPLLDLTRSARIRAIKQVCASLGRELSMGIEPSPRNSSSRRPDGAAASPKRTLRDIPEDLKKPVQGRFLALSKKQQQLLACVAGLCFRSGDDKRVITALDIESEFKRVKKSELFYRLEQLRLLGLINVNELGGYALTTLCADELGQVLVNPRQSYA